MPRFVFYHDRERKLELVIEGPKARIEGWGTQLSRKRGQRFRYVSAEVSPGWQAQLGNFEAGFGASFKVRFVFRHYRIILGFEVDLLGLVAQHPEPTVRCYDVARGDADAINVTAWVFYRRDHMPLRSAGGHAPWNPTVRKMRRTATKREIGVGLEGVTMAPSSVQRPGLIETLFEVVLACVDRDIARAGKPIRPSAEAMAYVYSASRKYVYTKPTELYESGVHYESGEPWPCLQGVLDNFGTLVAVPGEVQTHVVDDFGAVVLVDEDSADKWDYVAYF